MSRSRRWRGQGPRGLLPHPFRTMRPLPLRDSPSDHTIIALNAGQSGTCPLMNSCLSSPSARVLGTMMDEDPEPLLASKSPTDGEDQLSRGSLSSQQGQNP